MDEVLAIILSGAIQLALNPVLGAWSDTVLSLNRISLETMLKNQTVIIKGLLRSG